MARCLLLVILCCAFVSAYKPFQERIPNGERVPNPCSRDKSWGGVGHTNPLGGGPRNAFGRKFADEGAKISTCIFRVSTVVIYTSRR